MVTQTYMYDIFPFSYFKAMFYNSTCSCLIVSILILYSGQIALGQYAIVEFYKVSVWDRELSSTEFITMASGTFYPSFSPVQGWWNYRYTPHTFKLDTFSNRTRLREHPT